jgi:hypothetical protein
VTPRKSTPTKAVAKTALKVPSTRVDAGRAGKELAVRAVAPMTTTYGTGSSTVTITITHTNSAFTGVITVLGTVALPFTAGVATVTVPTSALGAIEDLGFPVTFGAPGPAPAYDANLDTLVAPIVSNAASTTSASLKAAFVAVGSVMINVKDHGVKLDWNGTTGTDDTAAWESVFAAVPADGAIVYVPAGQSWVPNGGLSCAHPVRIVGQMGLDGTGPRIVVTADAVTGLSLTSAASSVEMLNIAHPLTGTRSASLTGLSMSNANFSRLDGVRIEGFATDAAVSTGIYYSVLNCNFRDFVNTGLAYSNDTANGDAGDGTVFNCTFDRGADTVAGGTAMSWTSGGGLRFIDNKINGKSGGAAWFQHGLRLVPDAIAQTGVVIVTGNSIENFTGYGVSVDQGSSTFYNTVLITGNEINGTSGAAGSTGIYLNNTPSGVAITGNHIYSCDVGMFLERVKHASVAGNTLTNITTTGVHVGQFAKNIKIAPQPMDVVSGQHVLFDNPKVIADPCWELVVPFGGANGSGMPVISDNTGHDQVEIDLITGYSAVLVDIDVTGTVAGNGAWAARQQRMVAATNGGNATIQTIGTDFAYQGTGAVITQTAGTSKVTFGVQKQLGTDLSGHMRIRVRGAALSAVKQLNRYN